MGVLTELQSAVAANKSVIESAITLLTGLTAKLDEAIASNDPAEFQRLADSLKSETEKLAAAVLVNTGSEMTTGTGQTELEPKPSPNGAGPDATEPVAADPGTPAVQ